MKTLQEKFDIWDKGEYTYNEVDEKLLKLEEGEEIKDILSKCTICPVGNGTCTDYIELNVYGFNPDKVGKLAKLMICPFGVKEWGECPLSK